MEEFKEKVMKEEEIKFTIEYRGRKYTKRWNFTNFQIKSGGRMSYISGAKDAAAYLMSEALLDPREKSGSFFLTLKAQGLPGAFSLKSLLSVGPYHVRYTDKAYQGFGFGSYHRFYTASSPMRSYHIQIGKHYFFFRKEAN